MVTTTKNIEFCRKLNRQYGVSYYFATAFFPKQMREDTYVVYAFFRMADEYVDNAPDTATAQQQLTTWILNWQKAYTTRYSTDPILHETARVFHTYNIPYQYSEDFLKAMVLDLTKIRYATYAELEDYMYGSAAVVGCIMSHIIGYQSIAALDYAEKLGYAMQLTNFIRDVGEDYKQRGRIYLPQEDLVRFGVTEEMLSRETISTELRYLLEYEIRKAREIYTEALQGVTLLNKPGRIPVRVAAKLYSAILDKVIENNYDVLNKRASTTTWEKVKLAWQEITS